MSWGDGCKGFVYLWYVIHQLEKASAECSIKAADAYSDLPDCHEGGVWQTRASTVDDAIEFLLKAANMPGGAR